MKRVLIFFYISLVTGCLTGGTHGSISAYKYPVTKYSLENAIRTVIDESSNIKLDTILDFYNDGETYVTIKIFNGNDANSYSFRYYGDKKDWDTSKTSEIFIAYAYDKDGNGGSASKNNFDRKLKERIIKCFEEQFIEMLDRSIGKRHLP